MNLAKEHKLINAALDSYRSQLDTIPDELFDVIPANGGWSYAEVYSHILNGTLGASIAVDRCTHGTSKQAKGGVNWLGKVVLFLGQFPPMVKLKTPEAIAAKMAPQKISKEEARNLIMKCRKRIDDIVPVISESTSQRRAQHPRMGMLNSGQWFRFIRIHLQHHLKQLKRIENNFSSQPPVSS